MATMRVAKVKNKVLSDTMKLLSYTLVFGGLSSWFKTKMKLILGLGKTGVSIARFLTKQQVAFRIADNRNAPPFLSQ
jgi:hypothetical protein